jgi:polar amino acid transport system substrate-binding protein
LATDPRTKARRRSEHAWAGRASYAGAIALVDPSPAAIAALAPTGIVRAAINLSNFLLVTGRDPDGTPTGVSPDMARELARCLGVGIELFGYKSPGDLADAAASNAWDIGNIGAEPARAETIAFTSAYCEIECTYLVPAGSPITTVDEVDRPGVRIASAPRAAYDLWLERNLSHAELVRSPTLAGSFEMFVEQGLDALAGLRPALLTSAQRLPGSRLLDGGFSSVQQAMGTPLGRDEAGFAYLRDFVEEMKANGFVAGRIAAHGVVGLSVAPAASH